MATFSPGGLRPNGFNTAPTVAGFKPSNLASADTWVNMVTALKEAVEDLGTLTNGQNGRCLTAIITVQAVVAGAAADASVPASAWAVQELPADGDVALYNGAITTAGRWSTVAENLVTLWSPSGNGATYEGSKGSASWAWPAWVFTP